MTNPWQVETWRALLLLGSALLLGVLTGQLASFTALFLVGYIVYLLYQLHRLYSWLQTGKSEKMPEDSGLVGSIAYQVYQLRKRDRKRKIRLAELLERFRKSTAALPDGTVVLSADNQIDWFNKAAGKLLGLRSSDNGQPIGNLVRHPRFAEYLERQLERKAITISSPLDEKTLLELRIVPYGEGLRLLLARDVTRIVQTHQMRRDFIANASHELRTPLTVIKGYLEMLTQNDNESEPVVTHSLGKINYQVNRMQHLVEDLLTLSRMEDKSMQTYSTAIKMPVLLAQLKNEAKGLAVEKQQDIRVECLADEDLLANEKELHSAFGNLISNAVHYTEAGGEITVRWYLTDEAAVFEVEDNGVGIPSEHIPRLAERFYRVNTNSQLHRQGTGLGLSIVKHILEHYDASLDIESQLGVGSTFRCCFPLATTEIPQAQAVI